MVVSSAEFVRKSLDVFFVSDEHIDLPESPFHSVGRPLDGTEVVPRKMWGYFCGVVSKVCSWWGATG